MRDAALRDFSVLKDCRMEIRVVPNRGRDLGPIFTEFSSELQQYDLIGHIHTKKSIHYSNRDLIDNWVTFLLENIIGGKKPMLDLILSSMQEDPNLGLVFADDPHVIGWMSNRNEALGLLKKMGLSNRILNEFVNFPVGTMFWARPQALKPLFNLKLNWSDYPEEPVSADGTMLHAIERLFPVVTDESGYKTGVTAVNGLYR